MGAREQVASFWKNQRGVLQDESLEEGEEKSVKEENFEKDQEEGVEEENVKKGFFAT